MNVKQLRKALKKYDKKAPVVIAGDSRIWKLVLAGYYSEHCGGVKIFAVSDDVHTVRLEL